MANVPGLVNDPQFQSLSLADQRTALSGVDAAFGQLGDADFIRAVQGIKGAPNAGLPTGSLPPKVDMQQSGVGNAYGFIKGLASPSASMLANPIGVSSVGVPQSQPTQGFDLQGALKRASLGNATAATLQEVKGLNPVVTGQGAEGAGKTVGNLALLASGFGRGVDALPIQKARSGAALGEVKAAIGSRAIDVSAPGNAALRIKDLANTGLTMPKVVNDFLRRVTDPEKGPLTFAEARDFYSSANGKLSAAESARLSDRMKFNLTVFTQALGKSIQDEAVAGGEGAKFAGSMSEYHNAMRVRGAVSAAGKQAAKSLPYVGTALAVKKILGQ